MARLETSERKQFYLRSLEDHKKLLRSAINGMAEGELVHALNIAVSIRALIYESGRSKPLLAQLRNDYLNLPIYSAKEPAPDPRLAHLQKMTVLHVAANIQITAEKMSLRPTFDTAECQSYTLGKWWTNPGLVVPGGAPLSRKDIVLGIANKEGAHVDDDMPRNYRTMLESKSVRLRFGEGEYEAVNITRYVCGTAGVELLDCLARNFPSEDAT